MRFQIPHFIDIENKIVGPLTIKQFLYLAGAGGIIFMFFFMLKFWLWLILSAIIGAIGLAFAFAKYNGQPLPKIAFYALMFFWKPKLYLWKRETASKIIETPDTGRNIRDILSGMPSVKKLWNDMITTKNPIPKREKSLAVAKGRFQSFRKLTGEKEVAKRVDYR